MYDLVFKRKPPIEMVWNGYNTPSCSLHFNLHSKNERRICSLWDHTVSSSGPSGELYSMHFIGTSVQYKSITLPLEQVRSLCTGNHYRHALPWAQQLNSDFITEQTEQMSGQLPPARWSTSKQTLGVAVKLWLWSFGCEVVVDVRYCLLNATLWTGTTSRFLMMAKLLIEGWGQVICRTLMWTSSTFL